MIKKEEIAVIIISSIVLALVIALSISQKTVNSFGKNYLFALIALLIIITFNTLIKKITAYYLDTKIEIKFWEMKRYGYRTNDYLKTPINAGLIFPVVIAVLSAGYIKCLASIIFEVETMVSRAAKRLGPYKFSEVTESHIGLIAASGIIANFFLAGVVYLIDMPLTPTIINLSIIYSLWSIIPFSSLDGSKILFGNKLLWIVLTFITLLIYLWTIVVI